MVWRLVSLSESVNEGLHNKIDAAGAVVLEVMPKPDIMDVIVLSKNLAS